MGEISAFIFDLDGVITDTSEFHFRGWSRLAQEIDVPFSRVDNEKLRGISRRESLQILLNGRAVTEGEAVALAERKNAYYLELIDTLTPEDVLPGVLHLLDELSSAGIKTAIASSSKNAGPVIDKLQIKPFFQAIVDGLKVTQSKPAPDLFLQAAQELGILPGNCVVIEDAEAGIRAGKAAGMLTIGLGPVERIGAADVVLPDLRQACLASLLVELQKINVG